MAELLLGILGPDADVTLHEGDDATLREDADATNLCYGPVYTACVPRFREQTIFDVHLQWFAAEDEGRTEEPTEHKLRKAREEGKVAKSVELSSSLVILFGIATLGLISSYFLRNVLSMLRFFLQHSTELDIAIGRLSGSLPGQRHAGGISLFCQTDNS
jgi:hypothetical protein